MNTLTATELRAQNQELDNANKTLFGFWVYIMTDCVLFAGLFATYAVLHNSTFGGPAAKELFSMPYVLTETIILLLSSYTCGLAMLSVRRGAKNAAIALFGITFLLGLSFLTMELAEFRTMVIEGDSWRRSGFLSSYFTLVGTHGLHISVGLIWIAVLLYKLSKTGLDKVNAKRLSLLSMFWHFLDVIWIFIFTIVFMMGVLGV